MPKNKVLDFPHVVRLLKETSVLGGRYSVHLRIRDEDDAVNFAWELYVAFHPDLPKDELLRGVED
jgi:hypothetical protein